MWKFRWLSASASERIINNQSWGKSEMRFKGIHHVEFPVLDYDNSVPCADQWKTMISTAGKLRPITIRLPIPCIRIRA